MKVRMVVFPEPNRAEMREGELPALQEDEILVKVLYSGVSVGTERWILTNKIEGTKYPLVPGYQNVGIVEEVGNKVISEIQDVAPWITNCCSLHLSGQ